MKRHCISLVVLQSVVAFTSLIAETTIGLIGGQNGPSGYAAFVDENGNLTPIDLGITSGTIGLIDYPPTAVAINPSGLGLIGGENGSGAYAAFVGPGNTVTPLNLGVTTGIIYSTSINSSNLGLIGGIDNGNPYAASISHGSSPVPISLPPSGAINSVSVNSSGIGLLVGSSGFFPYVAIGNLQTSVPAIPLGISGALFSAAINDSGLGLIGGTNYNSSPNPLYVAFLDPISGVITVNMGGYTGTINSVAMNSLGAGIVGGQAAAPSAGTSSAYAALVSIGQSATMLSNIPTTNNGTIFSVAINSSGAGIIGGQGNELGNPTAGFAALVAPNGTVTPLDLSLNNALIQNVAINDLGIGLIGGKNSDTGAAYAALVAPNGSLTSLSLFNGSINSVAITGAGGGGGGGGILQAVVPTSIGSNLGTVNAQFAASYALNTHMTGKYRLENPTDSEKFALLVSASETSTYQLKEVFQSQSDKNMIWLSPFGSYVHQKAEGSSPSASNSIGGFLLGYDYSYSDLLFGGALGYAYNYIGFGSNAGHGSVQEELATFYGSYEQECLLVNFALWGGYYQWYNKRNTLSFISSKAHTQGWTLTPHIEVVTPFKRGIFFEPFAMFDYVNNWQGGYTEQGASGLNLVMDSHYSSILRSEAGLRLFEEWDVNIGKFVFAQKLSYVNQLPFYLNNVMTSFVASSASFPIAIGSSHVQNLGGVEVRGTFLPQNPRYPYITFGFQGEFGSSYQSYFGNIEIGTAF